MDGSRTTHSIRIIAVAALGALLGVQPAAAGPDPAKTVGAEACGECHTSELAAWKESRHYDTFNTLHRRPRAQTISDKLGIKSLKRDSLCIGCHYTEQMTGSDKQVTAGVSCESCHGAAKDWIDLHDDYGGKRIKREQETPEHKKQRIEQTVAKGMIRPDQIYQVAAQCYRCHTVPNERLVNVGGHAAGSDFELVSWLEGEVRHNFARSKANAEDPPERKRVMYVVGQGLALESNLRGVAKATEKDVYATAMARRVAQAQANLKKIEAGAHIAEVAEMLAATEKVELKLKNEAALTKAADQVAAAVKKFALGADGGKLGALDPLLPDTSQTKGKAHP